MVKTLSIKCALNNTLNYALHCALHCALHYIMHYVMHDFNDVVLMFLLLTLNILYTFSSVSTVDLEQVNVSWNYIALTLCKTLGITLCIKGTVMQII